MITYVFDTSALVRAFERGNGGIRVEELLHRGASGSCNIVISAVNWGEMKYTLTRLFGVDHANPMMQSLLDAKLIVVSATAERAERAALVKTRYKMGYADCFGVELAGDSSDHILVTADFGAKTAEETIRIEFLAAKEQP